MNVEPMGGWSNTSWVNLSFVRSSFITVIFVLTLAAVLSVPAAALGHFGSAGPLGIWSAAGVCLAGVLAGNVATAWCRGADSALLTLCIGIFIRMLPPLTACLFLASRGGGREHIAFVAYLLTFYLTTLTLDTFWAVHRVANNQTTLPYKRST